MSRIFISFSPKDEPYARRLAGNLQRAGFEIFINEKRDYPGGGQWMLDNSDAVIVIVSPEALKSQWVDKEIRWAMVRKKPILPLVIQGSAPNLSVRLSFGKLRVFDFSDGRMPGADFHEELSRATRQEIPTTGPRELHSWKDSWKGRDFEESMMDKHRGPRAEPPDETPMLEEEQKDQPARYANYDLYQVEEFSYEAEHRRRVEADQALRKDNWYEVEAWIASKPEGKPVEDEQGKRRPIRDPKNQEPIPIQVWFDVNRDDFEFDEASQLQEITLPPAKKGDSTRASFRVRPRQISPHERGLARIGVHFFYSFNDIEFMEIQVEVVGKNDEPKSALGLAQPIQAKYLKLGDWVQLEDVERREMHILVDSFESDHYQLTFIYGGLEYKGALRLTKEDLEDIIVNIRQRLEYLAVDKESPITLGEPFTLKEKVMELTGWGKKLWTKLFESDENKSLWHIGRFLKKYPVKEAGFIQVTIKPNAAGFVFPWNLLYDGEVDKNAALETVISGFWGYRYCVEQILWDKMGANSPCKAIQLENQLRVSFMLMKELPNAESHRKFIANLAENSHQKISITGPILNAGDCFNLLKDNDSHILYFYSRGYTRSRQADLAYRADPELIDGSSIELSGGKVYLDQLEQNKSLIDLRKGAVVFLNMCEGGQITPSLSEGFVPFFLEQGAGAVIGTECPIPTTYAQPFAEVLLDSFLGGDSLGKAMLTARRKFLKPGDLLAPLGLIYTLYGYGTLNYAPPPLAD